MLQLIKFEQRMQSSYIDNLTGEVVQLGLVEGLSNEAYHSSTGYSSSQVRRFGEQSPLHYWWATEGKQAAGEEAEEEVEETAESKDLRFGTIVHAAVLEPDLFTKTYKESLNYNARTVKGRAYRDDFATQCKAEGKIAIHPAENKAALAIRDRIYAHPVASGFFKNGSAEQSYFVLDKELGVVRKCRPDYLSSNGFAITDLKTTKSANPSSFSKDAANKGYDLACSWYLDVFSDLYGEAPKHFVWIAVEKTPPYVIGVFFAQEEDINRARITMRSNFERLVECHRTKQWNDWGSEALPLQIPRWAARG